MTPILNLETLMNFQNQVSRVGHDVPMNFYCLSILPKLSVVVHTILMIILLLEVLNYQYINQG